MILPLALPLRGVVQEVLTTASPTCRSRGRRRRPEGPAVYLMAPDEPGREMARKKYLLGGVRPAPRAAHAVPRAHGDGALPRARDPWGRGRRTVGAMVD